MREGLVRWVQITAGTDGPCRLRSPFPEDDDIQVCGGVPKREGNVLEWDMAAGQRVTVFLPGFEEPDLQQETAQIRAVQSRMPPSEVTA